LEVGVEAGLDIVRYVETILMRYTKYVVTVLASMLPIVSIVVLYTVQTVGWRLGVMAIFTAAFAAVLVIFTSANEVEPVHLRKSTIAPKREKLGLLEFRFAQ
jgi:phage-related protein